METGLRLLVVDAGLPVPVVNQPVLDDFDEVVHVPDLPWPRWRVAVDFDGAHHFVTDRTQDVAARRRVDWRRRHDIARQENLQAIGWTLRIATAYDVLHEPEALLHRIGRSLRDAGAQV